MKELEARFMEAIRLVGLSELARGTSRSRSSWDKLKRGRRRVTRAAARDLADYLRNRSSELTAAAERLEAAAISEEGPNG